MASRGFTLIEVILGLSLIGISVIATAPLFVLASRQNAGGGELGAAGAAAVRQMERLRATPYGLLTDGGNLTASVTGYADESDPRTVVRWVVATDGGLPANTRVLSVRAESRAEPFGQPKSVTLTSVRGE